MLQKELTRVLHNANNEANCEVKEFNNALTVLSSNTSIMKDTKPEKLKETLSEHKRIGRPPHLRNPRKISTNVQKEEQTESISKEKGRTQTRNIILPELEMVLSNRAQKQTFETDQILHTNSSPSILTSVNSIFMFNDNEKQRTHQIVEKKNVESTVSQKINILENDRVSNSYNSILEAQEAVNFKNNDDDLRKLKEEPYDNSTLKVFDRGYNSVCIGESKEKPIKNKNLNENYVRLNMKKKVFARGKTTFNFSKFKKNNWKKKKLAANNRANPGKKL